MKVAVATTFAIIAFVALCIGADWLATGNQFFLYKFFAPRQAAVERRVFEESKSYNQGMSQDLAKMQFEYTKEKDPMVRRALGGVILHRFADYDTVHLPADLANFIEELKINQNQPK